MARVVAGMKPGDLVQNRLSGIFGVYMAEVDESKVLVLPCFLTKHNRRFGGLCVVRMRGRKPTPWSAKNVAAVYGDGLFDDEIEGIRHDAKELLRRYERGEGK